MYLLGLIPFLFFLAAATVLATRRNSQDISGIRESIITAAVLTSLWVVAGTECLSLFRFLRFTPLLFWWGLPVLLMVWLLWKRRTLLRMPTPRVESRIDLLLIFGIVLVLAVTAFISLQTPPNNYDSQEYHLPREFMWMQQGHVGTFACNDERQLSMPPFTEFVGTHLMILSGSDAWVNMVQWLGLALVALTVSKIAQVLGCTRTGQLFASLFAVSEPTAAIQALNTKNDVVTGLFVCTAALISAQIGRDKNCSWQRALLLGGSIGLAMLSKGTGMLFVIPISLFSGCAIMVFHRWRGIVLGGLITGVVFLINLGHFSRNYSEFDSIFGRSEARGGYPLRNTSHAPAALISNVSRNIAMHLTFSLASDRMLSNSVVALHEVIGIDVNDPQTTFGRNRFSIGNLFQSPANQVRSPLHMMIALFALFFVAWPKGNLPGWKRWFCLLPFAAFLFFCFEVKWQVWHNRLHVPLFALLAPVAALQIGRSRPLAGGMSALLFCYLVPLLVDNDSKALRGERSIFRRTPEEIRFSSRPQMLPGVEWIDRVCSELKPRTIAIVAHPNTWIYPVQRVLAQSPGKPEIFFHRPIFGKRFAVTNVIPDLMVAVDETRRPRRDILTHESGTVFHFTAECSIIGLYLPKNSHESFQLFPPFHGWASPENIQGLEGPYSQGNGLAFYWGKGMATKLAFVSDGSPSLLTMEARAEKAMEGIPLIIELNGFPIQTNTFPTLDFEILQVPITPTPGTNRVTLIHSPPEGVGVERMVGFKKLWILPQR